VWVEAEADGVFAVGARAEQLVLTGGAAARLVVRGAWLGASLGVAGLAPVTLVFPSASTRVWRVPIDVSARVRVAAGGRVEFYAEVGAALAVVHAVGLGLDRNTAGTRAGGGGRVAAGVRVAVLGPVGLALAAEGYLAVLEQPLAVTPSGEVGTVPRGWFGALAGIFVRTD
jgi:hypothetical protein